MYVPSHDLGRIHDTDACGGERVEPGEKRVGLEVVIPARPDNDTVPILPPDLVIPDHRSGHIPASLELGQREPVTGPEVGQFPRGRQGETFHSDS